ncbi:DMT family transporter [Martelella alba]|uniref:EamA family transporter n=1 Tax=Martelella alba TaxID=2590451 RepID=A0ABY2SH95_9HYPH|nr:DMT family transporter [Martelella alba]TKI04662.1 EamA family transporter [Martelella alba]
MEFFRRGRQPGVAAALGAAVLFGAGTPLAKMLLQSVNPWLLAALLYLGSGLGLFTYRFLRRKPSVILARDDVPWLVGAIGAGGVAGPLLLMFGLSAMPASGASLLLNAESVFTALLAWLAFRENVDRRIALGMVAIAGGAVVLGWQGELRFAGLRPALLILAACFAWAVDNNLTRRVSLTDATWLAAVKGLVAGVANLCLALGSGSIPPPWPIIAGGLVVGFLAYGVSLTLFVVALRHLGSARTGAYFAVAPFVGALLAILSGEPLTPRVAAAGLLMGVGVWLHLTERHQHRHHHEALEHDHEHRHDEHHQHSHPFPIDPAVRHSHPHYHPPLTHNHTHFPDAHHRHSH